MSQAATAVLEVTQSQGEVQPLLIRACSGEPLERPPVWMMRQAGRYMAEYQVIRAEMDFLALCKHPEKAAEVSLQPLNAFGMDGVIVFSDILIPVEAMGLEVVFTEGEGPKMMNPVRNQADVDRLTLPDPVLDMPNTLTALSLLRKELASQPEVALIGFAGAPWTMATYMIEGGSYKHGQHIKRMMTEAPKALHQLLDKTARVVGNYLCAQIEAGAQMVQLFDTWGGQLSAPLYQEWVLPYQQQVFEMVQSRYPNVPTILYVKNTRGLLPFMQQSGALVMSIDETVTLTEAREAFGQTQTIQGNLDPVYLNQASPETLIQHTQALLKEAGNHHYLFNLGHGILPKTPIENVRAVVDTVKAWRHA